MRTFIIQMFALLILLASVYSCDKKRVYDRYIEIPESTWHKDSIIVFDIPVTDTLQNYNFLIQIRNETSYSFSNLWLFVEINQPEGKTVTDTFEVVLAEPSGRWLGDGYGGLKTRQAIYRRNVSFPVSGKYTVCLQHGMRVENLKGIHDVGFRIEKTAP